MRYAQSNNKGSDSKDEDEESEPDDPFALSVGGAMMLTGGRVKIKDMAFVNNEAKGGGALYIGPLAEVDITRASFFNNKATGKIVVEGGVSTVAGCCSGWIV